MKLPSTQISADAHGIRPPNPLRLISALPQPVAGPICVRGTSTKKTRSRRASWKLCSRHWGGQERIAS